MPRSTLGPGGQAANVAAWAAALGATARFVGKRGADEPGRLALAGLDGARRRGSRADRGPKRRHLLARVFGRRALDGIRPRDCTRVSRGRDRSRMARRLRSPVHLRVRAHRRAGPKRRAARGRDRASAGIRGERRPCDLERHPRRGTRRAPRAVAKVAPDVVFATEREEEIFGGPLSGVQWISKRGARGCSFVGDERAALPVAQVVDTTGAGDALAAGWIVGGPDLALEAAARCVQRVGAMPDARLVAW